MVFQSINESINQSFIQSISFIPINQPIKRNLKSIIISYSILSLPRPLNPASIILLTNLTPDSLQPSTPASPVEQTTCGVCGDAADGPRDHETGGRFATGAIAKNYKQGDVSLLVNQINPLFSRSINNSINLLITQSTNSFNQSVNYSKYQ